jgi:hypothetical protein
MYMHNSKQPMERIVQRLDKFSQQMERIVQSLDKFRHHTKEFVNLCNCNARLDISNQFGLAFDSSDLILVLLIIIFYLFLYIF